MIQGGDPTGSGMGGPGYTIKGEFTANGFTNNLKHDEDFERQFTAQRPFDNTQPLSAVQEELVGEMVKDIADQIFNATVANW